VPSYELRVRFPGYMIEYAAQNTGGLIVVFAREEWLVISILGNKHAV